MPNLAIPLIVKVCGAATATFNPAITGLMPSIADASRLQQANALRGLAISASYIVGPAIAGAVAALNAADLVGIDLATRAA